MRYALYGTLSFANRTRREAAATFITAEATRRGFTALAFGPHPAGVVATNNTTLSVCFVHGDLAAVEAALTDINATLQTNQYDGSFGYSEFGA